MLPDHEYHPLEVVSVIDETADTRSFVLGIPPDFTESFFYAAGQFCTFRAPIEGETVVRSYSMSSSPDTDDPFMTTVKRVPEGRMSNWMNDALAPGDVIEVMRPTGLFVLHPREVPIVAFAGGSGITPVISIIKSALVTTDRSITLVYANRDADSVIFRDELARLVAASDDRLSVHHHLDSDGGFLDADRCAAFVGDSSDADFYVCGPGPYMDTVEAGLAIVGIDPGQLFIERFVIPEDVPADHAVSATESVVLTLGKQTHTLSYRHGDTILETARSGGVNPPFSCEAGNCATCMAHLDAGSATMRVNNALTREELDDGWILTCQAIPTSPEVVVDYDA